VEAGAASGPAAARDDTLVDVADTHTLVRRFQTALDLWATGVELRRQALRRRHPRASEAEIDHLLGTWLSERPGAEHGDGPQREGP
jgi:hypothetical protein